MTLELHASPGCIIDRGKNVISDHERFCAYIKNEGYLVDLWRATPDNSEYSISHPPYGLVSIAGVRLYYPDGKLRSLHDIVVDSVDREAYLRNLNYPAATQCADYLHEYVEQRKMQVRR